MIPLLNRSAVYTLTVPEFSGGINKRDGSRRILDDQLTDGLNVWHREGTLKTRPGYEEAMSFFKEVPEGLELKVRAEEHNKVVSGGKEYAVVTAVMGRKGEEYTVNERISVMLISKDLEVIDLGEILTADLYTYGLKGFAVVHRDSIYVFMTYYCLPEGDYINEIYRATQQNGVFGNFKKVSAEEIYAPVILTNCVSSINERVVFNSPLRNSVQVEGFNLIGNRYRMIFTMYDYTEDAYKFDEQATYMKYALPYTPTDTMGFEPIIATYTDKKGKTYTHRVSTPNGFAPSTVETSKGEDGLYLHAVNENGICYITFNTVMTDDHPDPISETQLVYNNLTVNAPCREIRENARKVMLMQETCWYGNNALGINGGSRLFLGGNEEQPALILWSNADEPTYFSENNYVFVGDKNQRVTAFGKQGESLIIFKEREIYSTKYTEGEVTAEELISQEKIDAAAHMAYFPMTQLHSGIGCAGGDSVQLIRNRLVWAGSDGRIYTLSSRSQYSERNVFTVSEAIDDDIKSAGHVASADWMGHYIYLTDKKVFVMDYNSYGYVNIAAYNRDTDANKLIPWYEWDIGRRVLALSVLGDSLMMIFYENGQISFGRMKEDTEGDNGKGIGWSIRTKQFDFGAPERLKRVIEADIYLKHTGGRIGVTFFGQGQEQDSVMTRGEEIRLHPELKLCDSFGFMLEGEGTAEIETACILYRIAGRR